MRPCRQCRAPVENNAAACPQCGAAQDDGPRVNSESKPPERPGFVRQLFQFVSDLVQIFPPLAIAVLALPLAVGGVIGYLIADRSGAVVGVIASIALIIGLTVWGESGG